MKKILILVNRTLTNKNSFHAGLKEKLGGQAEIDIAHFEDIIISIEQDNTSVLIGEKDIRDYDITYFRRAGREFLWLAATVAAYLESAGKKYFDSTYKEVGPTGAKLTSLLKLAVNGMPVIPTFFCYKGNILQNSDLIISRFGLPLVMKDLYSQRGRGVFLINEKKDIESLVSASPDKKFMFQKFVDKKEEFRVLVLGETIGSFETKTSQDPKEFRNNVSLGAREDFIDIDKIPPEILNVSVASAKILKIEIAGVDVTIDRSGKVWILEVNRGPGFTYLSEESPEIASVAKFFLEELAKIK